MHIKELKYSKFFFKGKIIVKFLFFGEQLELP